MDQLKYSHLILNKHNFCTERLLGWVLEMVFIGIQYDTYTCTQIHNHCVPSETLPYMH